MLTPTCLEKFSPMKNGVKRFFNPKIEASYRPASPLDFKLPRKQTSKSMIF